MENLHIEANPACRTVRHAGNEVLCISYPIIRGDTPAAQHTAQLTANLIKYAEEVVAEAAAAALYGAAKEGRLFDFIRHTYSITASATAQDTHTTVTVTACHTAGDTVLHTHTLKMYWYENETLQLKKAPRTRARKFSRAQPH